MAQKIGSASRLLLYPETTPGVDPGSPVGYVVPLYAESTVVSDQPPVEAPIFMGARRPFGSVAGLINVNGGLPVGLEFDFLGVLLKMLTGASAAPVATAGGFLHYFPWAAATVAQPTFQLQDEFLDGAPVYIRKKQCMLNDIKLNYATNGVAQLASTVLGTGEEVYTDLAGTKTDYGYAGVSYYNGYLSKAGTRLASVTAFDMMLGNDVQRQDVAFNDGIAGNVYPGIPMQNGNLSLMFEDLAYYNQGVLNSYLALECLWANAGLSTLSKFFLMSMPQTKFFRKAPGAGGKLGKVIPQAFRVEIPDLTATGANALAAFAFSGVQTFNIVGGTSDKLGIKIDGGATITKTLTAGAARTAAQIVTDIGAVTGGAADVWPANVAGTGGRVRIQTSTLGVGGSVQIDTAVAQSAHTVLGFDSTVRTGKAAAHSHLWLFNGQSAQY